MRLTTLSVLICFLVLSLSLSPSLHFQHTIQYDILFKSVQFCYKSICISQSKILQYDILCSFISVLIFLSLSLHCLSLTNMSVYLFVHASFPCVIHTFCVAVYYYYHYYDCFCFRMNMKKENEINSNYTNCFFFLFFFFLNLKMMLLLMFGATIDTITSAVIVDAAAYCCCCIK